MTEIVKPSVTLHKGGGKIVITPNDITSAVALVEIRERLNAAPVKDPYTDKVLSPQLLTDVTLEDFSKATLCWSLIGVDTSKHPIFRLLNRYGLEVELSPSLAGWIKKGEKRSIREATPFLLPDYADKRPLFDKVEAGMVLNCIKTFMVDKQIVFQKENRYQVVDTARETADETSKDGMVKINKTHVRPDAANTITLDDESCFAWTIFSGDMEDYFHIEEKIIYDPKKCMPKKYPELVKMYTKKVKQLDMPLYDHVAQDAAQEAIKRSTLNGKLMRCGKSSESITVGLLWGSKKIINVSPRNARIFTVKEFERLGITDYVVVNEMADLEKEATFYLCTYSWLKGNSDKGKKVRSGPSYFARTFTPKKKKGEVLAAKVKDVIVEHKCPFCTRSLERLLVTTKKSEATGFVLQKTMTWTKEGGYICRNKNCKATSSFMSKKKEVGMKLGSKTRIPIMENANEYIGYIDWGLKFHQDCKDKSVKGRYCHECKQADSVWVPAPYKRKVLKKNRNKKVHMKDFFTGAIIDEIHAIKSSDSAVGKAIRSFRTKRRMGLTGTLMPNTPADSYWPLHYIFKGGSKQFPYHQEEGANEYYNTFCESIVVKRGKGLKDSRKMLPYLKNPIQFWELMSSKMVRRNYEDPLVISSLLKAGRHYPSIEFHRVESTMDTKQAALMVSAINHFEENFNEYVNETQKAGHVLNQAMVVSQMTNMRIGATCPEHFNAKLDKRIAQTEALIEKSKNLTNLNNELKALKDARSKGYNGPLGGGKMHDIKSIVATQVAAGEKVVILTDFVEMRKSLGLELNNYYPIVFDGAWDDAEREEAFDTFANDSTRAVFIAGTRQVREGTTLSANTVICCDLLWEPGLQQQAWSRAFTPTAEKRTCNVYMLMSKNSIDTHVFSTFYAKVAAAEQALDRKVINKRAHQIDLRWFVDRVISDRLGLVEQLKEEGDAGILVKDNIFKQLEDRDV